MIPEIIFAESASHPSVLRRTEGLSMASQVLEIDVSMQKSFRMEILSSDSDSLHPKALDCNIQFRNSFKFWKMSEISGKFRRLNFSENSEIAEKKLEFHKWNFGVQKSEVTIPKALPHNFPHHATWNAHRIPNGAKHSPRSAIYMKCVRPRWPLTISS